MTGNDLVAHRPARGRRRRRDRGPDRRPRPARPADVAIAVALVGLAIVAAATLFANGNPGDAFDGAYRVDPLTTFLDLLFVSIVALTIVFAPDYLAAARACRWPSSRSSSSSP